MSSRTSFEERKRHREEFYAKHPYVRRPETYEDDYHPTASQSLRVRISPYAVLVFCFAILFGVYWLVTRVQDQVQSGAIRFDQEPIEKIKISKANKIYTFHINQSFASYDTPQYSELEMELLDENKNHVYSFYKDLWLETHSNGDGGYANYSDMDMYFELELEKAGTYYLRAISHNGNNSTITYYIKSRSMGGNLYIGVYAIIFLSISAIFIFGSDYWGNPLDLMAACPSVSVLKSNKLFLVAFAICAFIFLACIVINITHLGYGSFGDETLIPTRFFGTDNVNYIG